MSAGLQDDRSFDSDYFLTREEVDYFKNEVKARPQPPADAYESEPEVRTRGLISRLYAEMLLQEENVRSGDDIPSAEHDDSSEDKGGDPTDGESHEAVCSECSKNWKSNKPEHTQVCLKCWDQSGFFGGACRHGLILKFCEMWQSGEL